MVYLVWRWNGIVPPQIWSIDSWVWRKNLQWFLTMYLATASVTLSFSPELKPVVNFTKLISLGYGLWYTFLKKNTIIPYIYLASFSWQLNVYLLLLQFGRLNVLELWTMLGILSKQTILIMVSKLSLIPSEKSVNRICLYISSQHRRTVCWLCVCPTKNGPYEEDLYWN